MFPDLKTVSLSFLWFLKISDVFNVNFLFHNMLVDTRLVLQLNNKGELT